MDKEQLIAELTRFKERLEGEVYSAYLHKGSDFGTERFGAWTRAIYHFLENNLPSYKSKLHTILNPGIYFGYGDPVNQFLNDEYSPSLSFIDSLILDIENNEVEFVLAKTPEKESQKIKPSKLLRKAFIVHGHDEATKFKTARFLEKLGFDVIILHEQANGGKTIIEKLEHFTDVGFGIVLYTPDDEGSVKDKKNYQPRARQNVVFEHGLLIGKLGRDKVFPLVTDHSVELPGDINGMVYLSDTNWELQLAKEIRELGYEIDMNKVI
ncbi:nucleotide-binding protein [Acinetobacter sp. ANC 3882]|uniref:TIR domain-containing protein n=1 Tax=Acinetobacter sp. ANC 3882 TaxID=2923423 RepID=UPI001F4ADDC2|nr:nucleotide-binding protein [Acinetobacter sp. ANC 3882]MCH7314645.1 nucleotide-binding protein [Acinetobacter sp. ANC 3882]